MGCDAGISACSRTQMTDSLVRPGRWRDESCFAACSHALLGLGSGRAVAQIAPGDPAGNQTIPEKDLSRPAEGGTQNENATSDGNQSLSDKLDKSGGVIKPAEGVDPKIVQPAPVPNQFHTGYSASRNLWRSARARAQIVWGLLDGQTPGHFFSTADAFEPGKIPYAYRTQWPRHGTLHWQGLRAR
jgi:hypothetical protein